MACHPLPGHNICIQQGNFDQIKESKKASLSLQSAFSGEELCMGDLHIVVLRAMSEYFLPSQPTSSLCLPQVAPIPSTIFLHIYYNNIWY